MQYIVNNTKELVEAYALAGEGDSICIVISAANDFELYFDAEEMPPDSSWKGCAC